jgi:hypothetical protein
MERYKITWLQSASHKAATQSVLAVIAGAPSVTILNDAAMNVSSFEHVFPTGATVALKIRTFNEAKSEFADLDVPVFTATDLSPLTPATNPSVVWVGHE